ncbi:hypothetical protein Poli38472_008192 [Pythium oligandrum]|uniref:TOG domain-containing protein n=1 Tax=Pythium oligandrum TaxID=41045 RepID=A0A8K1FJ01_PYTOL|nr:hypothetical protein Poli38472_008192 [Pythium oligandrum]|eukprot:TMW65550.1 hypothetical protein Poli38472_008192 [Pythium oligandrum]
MEEKCLRNMSCTCRLCAGEDIAMLVSISKSISSNIQYDEGDDADNAMEMAPPPPTMGRMTNSPPLPAARKTVAAAKPPSFMQRRPAVQNSPQVTVAAPPSRFRPPVREEPMDTAEDDAMMADVPMAPATPARAPPPPVMARQAPPVVQDTEMVAASPAPVRDVTMAATPGPAPAAPSTASVDVPPVEELVTKLADKNWKVRKEAYEQVKALCEQPGIRGDAVTPLLEFFHKMCEDANASAMEAGMQAVLAYAQKVEPFNKAIVTPVMKRVTDKGFSGRPGTVKICEEIVSMFIEAGAAEDTVAALIEGTKNKKPKVPPACASSILEGLKAFGPRVLPVQAIKAALPALCESTVNGVRPVALNILAEIHRWTGPALIQDVVSNLRQAQQTEYETLTKDIVLGQAQATKFVRGAKPPPAARSKASGGAAGGASGAAAGGGFDAREFAETVNLLDKLPKSEFKSKLAEPKWSMKVEALKIVLDLIGPVPKLANGDYYELVNTLKQLSNDSNVNIVAKSIEVLGALSDGLRKNFNQYARLMYPELMKKLSDKKSVILNAVNNTLDLFLQHSMTIDMMMDEIRLGVDPAKNKAPQARVQVIGFLQRCVEKKMVNLSDRGLVVDFGGMFMNGMEDVDPTVRKAGVDAFVVLVKASDQTAEFTRGLMDEISRKNPRSFKTIQQAVGGASAGGGASSSAPPSRPSSAGSQRSVKTAPEVVEVDMSDAVSTPSAPPRGLAAKPARGPPSRLAGKTTESAKPAAAGARKPAGGSSGAGGGGDFTPFSMAVDAEEAESILVELNIETWGSITEGLGSSKWMERKSAIESLEDFATQNSNELSVRVLEALTLYLGKSVKDFKDSNINVLRSAFQAIGTFAAQTTGKFPRGIVCYTVPSAVDKIGDRKASETIRNMILQLCESTSPAYVLGCIMNHMSNVKTPLAHIEVLTVLSECITDFGVSSCNPRVIVDHVKGSYGLESSNPKVRSGAISVLGVMYSQLGPALLPILNLESWKPALASTVEAEFKKVGFDPAKAAAGAKRQIKDEEEGGKKADAGALFGRVDISAQITKELLADMKCEEDKTAWKKRLAAMDSVQAICEGAGCAIEFTKPVIELMKGLKARLSDSNANLKVKAAQVIGVVASSIGPEVAKLSKGLGPSLLSGVSDNKKNMQVASIEALHKWVRHNNQTSVSCVESLISSVSEALMNPVGRADLLAWTAEHLKACDRLDLSSLVAPTIQCLMDKSSEAREKAQLVLAEVIKSVGKDSVLTNGCRDVKPAQMRTLKPLIEKAAEAAAESANAARAAAAQARAAAPVQVPESPAPAESAPPQLPGSAGPSRLSRMNSAPSRPGAPGGIRSQLARPGGSFHGGDVSAPEPASHDEPSASAGWLRMNNGKSSRLAKGQFNKWIFDPISQTEMASRKSEIDAEWRPYLSPEFHAKLFAPSLEKGMMAALDDLMVVISNQPQEVLAALDLLLKWCSLRIVDNNVQALAKLLEVLVKLFELLKSVGYHLDDVEAAIILPYLLQESGQSKPRFRLRFRDIMRLVVDVYSTENYVNYLMECFNTSKNTKSRCECIDLVEYIVKTHGFNAVGKKCIKEIGKLVTAHEKDLRESAVGAMIAVYLKTDGNIERFYRFVGVTTQQGMDLLATKIKFLPPGSFSESTTAPSQPEVAYSAPVAQAPSFGARTPSKAAVSSTNSTPISGLKQFNDQPVAASSTFGVNRTPAFQHQPQEDEDVVMATPGREDQGDAIGEFFLEALDGLFTETRDIVDEASQAYVDGVDTLKGLYSIIYDPKDEFEVHFLRLHVNELAIRFCDLIHAGLGKGDPKKPMAMVVLTLSLSALHELLLSRAIDGIQRYAVERILLEAAAKILDPRFEGVAHMTNCSKEEAESLHVDQKRSLYLLKALSSVLVGCTKKVKSGELYPSVINLLQRIVRNDVGDYNSRDSYNHLMKKDSLDQLIGRLLLKISTAQAEALNAFEGIDIFGVLMQMHSFFSTLPQNDLFAVQFANDNMQRALQIIAGSLMTTRRATFESSVNDLPLTSPVRELLSNMGCMPTSSSTLNGSHFSGYEASSSAAMQSSGESAGESITRRLFDAGPTSTSTTSALPSSRFSSLRYKNSALGSTRDTGIRSSFTSSNDFAHGDRYATTTRNTIGSVNEIANDIPHAASHASTARDLRERLERMRKA